MSNDEPESVLFRRGTDGITLIAINRVQRRNAVNPATALKLAQAFTSFEEDETQKICVFHSTHGSFCAGFDLVELAQTAASNKTPPSVQTLNGRELGPMGPSRMQVKKPVICAVEGYAVAGGLELSLLGDIRVAAEDAVFGVFCRRFGVPLIDGGTVRLQAIVGLGRAMDMILTGRPVTAPEALQMGLVNRVVAKGRALDEAMKIAKQLLTFPQACMNVDRTNCYYSAYNAKSFEDALQQEYNSGVQVVSTESIAGATEFSQGKGRHGDFKTSKL
ncbi:hypothetical protein VHEMI00021 [[Torrubiella] hemipterigena]|uniref:Enoyl-CoA hydratase/isomerase family protein n=1 Tax=[Torrubiella] hemipterigena TaxID=1531966 RepID=A0A0A1SP82_9HYPO|nr:hypothetical protein VHEMI00021 [[Torrubiella] hemipterigena]